MADADEKRGKKFPPNSCLSKKIGEIYQANFCLMQQWLQISGGHNKVEYCSGSYRKESGFRSDANSLARSRLTWSLLGSGGSVVVGEVCKWRVGVRFSR